MNARRILVVVSLGGMALSSSCAKPDPIICPPGSVYAPTLITPHNYAYTAGPTAVLSWKYKGFTYPYPQPYPTPSTAYKCQPQHFRISLSMAPTFQNELGGMGPGALNVSWTTPALQAGQTYRWSVVAISKGQEGPPSETRFFSVGDFCTSVSQLKLVSGLWPTYGSTQDTLTPEILWGTQPQMQCLPRGYLIQYSHTQNFGTYEWTTSDGPASGFRATLPKLENCTTYFWRVAAYLGSPPGATGVMPSPTGPYGDAMMFQVALGGKCIQQPATLPQQLATLPPGPIPPESKLWDVTMNANCRAGPGTAYNEKGFAPKGFQAEIQGRNEDGTWFRLLDPSGISCWVSKIALEVPADWDIQPVLTYPSPPPPPADENPPPGQVNPPGPAPDPCSKNQDVQSCLAQPGCFYDRYKAVCVTK